MVGVGTLRLSFFTSRFVLPRSVLNHRVKRPAMTSSRPADYSTVMIYDQASNCQMTLSVDNSLAEVKHPGWSIHEINPINCLLQDPFYLRVWRLAQFCDFLGESVKKIGWLDLIRYERTHYTYVKCTALQLSASSWELQQLGSLPFHYGLNIRCWLSRVGRTSFQLETEMRHRDTEVKLAQYTTLYVSVDKPTRKVTENPVWWAEKYRAAASGRSTEPLRVTLPREYPEENLICRSSTIVQSLELDYYGHANNSSYLVYAMNAVLNAQAQNKLPWTFKQVENSIRRMECDFVSDCGLGDRLDMFVYRDTEDDHKLYVTLCKQEKVIYVQMFLYEDTIDVPKL